MTFVLSSIVQVIDKVTFYPCEKDTGEQTKHKLLMIKYKVMYQSCVVVTTYSQ